MIQKIANKAAFKNTLDRNYRVITAFTANNSTPFHDIKPYVEELAKDNPEIRFVNIDVDEAGELVNKYKIKETPTFVAFKNEKWVDSIVTADHKDVRVMVEQLSKI